MMLKVKVHAAHDPPPPLGQQLIQDNAQRPQVGLHGNLVRLTAGLLRGHVGWRSQQYPGLRQLLASIDKLNSRQKQADQHRNDGDDHQQLN